MFGLVQFADGIMEIQPMTKIRRRGNKCMAKYRGAYYEVEILAENRSKEELVTAMEQVGNPNKIIQTGSKENISPSVSERASNSDRKLTSLSPTVVLKRVDENISLNSVIKSSNNLCSNENEKSAIPVDGNSNHIGEFVRSITDVQFIKDQEQHITLKEGITVKSFENNVTKTKVLNANEIFVLMRFDENTSTNTFSQPTTTNLCSNIIEKSAIPVDKFVPRTTEVEATKDQEQHVTLGKDITVQSLADNIIETTVLNTDKNGVCSTPSSNKVQPELNNNKNTICPGDDSTLEPSDTNLLFEESSLFDLKSKNYGATLANCTEPQLNSANIAIPSANDSFSHSVAECTPIEKQPCNTVVSPLGNFDENCRASASNCVQFTNQPELNVYSQELDSHAIESFSECDDPDADPGYTPESDNRSESTTDPESESEPPLQEAPPAENTSSSSELSRSSFTDHSGSTACDNMLSKVQATNGNSENLDISHAIESFSEYDDSDADPGYTPENDNISGSITDLESESEPPLQEVPLAENTNTSSELDRSSFTNNASVTVCDDMSLNVRKSRGRHGDQKYNFCLYCKRKQLKIARHLENVHSTEEDVKKFLLLSKCSRERRDIIGAIRVKGNFLFNTNKSYNDGELIVARRPNRKYDRSACDYRACANCKAFFATRTLRAHFSKCTGKSSLKTRVVMVASKRIMSRIHERASEKVRKHLFPPLREDKVVRNVRYDELVILYANHMCEKYKEVRHYEMIRSRIRLLGRFLLKMREMSKEITSFQDVYDPKFTDFTRTAISEIAQYDPEAQMFKTPSVAFALGTLLKQVGKVLINECIKKHNKGKQENVENFLKLPEEEVNIYINRTVAESQVQQQRRKSVRLPSLDDIKMLRSYLKLHREQAFDRLQSGFSQEAWTKLMEFTLVSVQLFNRRRAGEVERILIEDFNNCQSLEENMDKDLFKMLSPDSIALTKNYVRFAIRGKLNRTVPVLLDCELLECIKLIIKHRRDANVSKRNPYVFGVNSSVKGKHKYLRACILMRKFATACGAKCPDRLRGTELRKHVATTCILLNLPESDVTDVANFMGHSKDIHKNIYRQPILSREVLQISKILEAAQGCGEEESENDDEMENSDHERSCVLESEQPSKKNRTDDSCPSNVILSEAGSSQTGRQSSLKTQSKSKKKKRTSTTADSDSPSPKKRRSTSPYGFVKRRRWSEEEKSFTLRYFSVHLEEMRLPSMKEAQRVINENPVLQTRSAPQLRTWLYNQFKDKVSQKR